MKKALPVLLLGAVAMPFTFSHANDDTRFYFGTDYSLSALNIAIDEDNADVTSNPSVVSFTIGAHLTDNLALEARLGSGIDEDTVTVSVDNTSVEVDDITVELDQYYGVYAKYIIPINDGTRFYATAGYTEVELSARSPDSSAFNKDDDYSFGFGATFALNEKLHLNAEFISLGRWDEGDGEETTLGIANFGLKYSL